MRTGWLGALGSLVGVGAVAPRASSPPSGGGGGAPSSPPQNLAQPQHGFSSANPGPAWDTWDSYPTYTKTHAQPTTPYTAACGQWSAPLQKGEIDGFLYSTATMLVEYANGQPVTQQTKTGLYLFALENEMVTVRKCLAPSVPIQQAKFTSLRGAPAGLGALPVGLGAWLAGMPVGLGGCGPGCDSCPFCKSATHAFGGTVVGARDSCGHVHPAITLPDHAGLGALGGCGGGCGGDDGQLGAAAPRATTPPAYVNVPGGGATPLPGAPTSTAGGHGGATPPWAFQQSVQPGQAPDGSMQPLTYVPVAQQMPLRPPGKMAYQPTLPWWTTWHKDEQIAFNCWWVNQQFAEPVCGLGHVSNLPASPDFDQLRWVLRMGIPWDPSVQRGLGAMPGKVGGGKPLEALAILAASLGVSLATVLGLKVARR